MLLRGKQVFVYGTSVSSHFSSPGQNSGPFMVACRGGAGLMADSWPSDKASSLQALTGNGTRAGALCWTACYESGCQQVAVCTDADPGRLAKGSGPARSTSSSAGDSRYLDYFRYVHPTGVTLVFLESKTEMTRGLSTSKPPPLLWLLDPFHWGDQIRAAYPKSVL